MKPRKCPTCKEPMIVHQINENERVWRCSVEPKKHYKFHEWRCGLCGRWGGSDSVADEGSPTGHAHSSCRDRELLKLTCTCGFEELVPRGSGLSVLFREDHEGEGHSFKVERTFQLTGRRITTLWGEVIRA